MATRMRRIVACGVASAAAGLRRRNPLLRPRPWKSSWSPPAGRWPWDVRFLATSAAASDVAGSDSEEESDEEDLGDVEAPPPHLGKVFLHHWTMLPRYDGTAYSDELLRLRTKLIAARTGPQLRASYEQLKRAEEAAYGDGSYDGEPLGWDAPAPHMSKRAKPLVYGPPETIGYVWRRLLPAYTVAHRVLDEAREHLPDFAPKSMLDFGCGPGTVALAATEVWGPAAEDAAAADEEAESADGVVSGGGDATGAEVATIGDSSAASKVGFETLRLVEQSQSMLDAAAAMLSGISGRGVSVGFGASLLGEAKAAARAGLRFDLVVAADTLSLLPTHAARAAATAILWECVAPGGLLVVVDSGDARGSHTVRSARQFVLNWRQNEAALPTLLAADRRRRGGRRMTKEERDQGKGDAASAVAARSSNPNADKDRSDGLPMARVVAPCRHDGLCPLAPVAASEAGSGRLGRPCAFRQRIPAPFGRAEGEPNRYAGGARGRRSFSYVVLQKRPKTAALAVTTGTSLTAASEGEGERRSVEAAARSNSPVEVLRSLERARAAGGGDEAVERELSWLAEGSRVIPGVMERGDWSRLVSTPLKKPRLVSLEVCTPAGTIERRLVGRRRWRHVPGLYISARKSELGALWPEI